MNFFFTSFEPPRKVAGHTKVTVRKLLGAVFYTLIVYFYLHQHYELCVCVAGVTVVVELLARSQYSEGPATGHLDTGFSWFPCVCEQMLTH